MSPGSDGSPVPAPLDPRIDFLAGTLAGIASLFVGHPLDTCKTRLQALSTASHYAPAEGTSRGAAASAMTVLRVMMKEEGIRGFYKGVTSPLLGVAAMNACVFTSYSSALDFLSRSSPSPSSDPPLTSVFLAGTFSGIVTSVVTTPTDRIKVLQQAYPSHTRERGVGTWTVVRKIVRKQGLRGIYKGMGATMLRDTGYGPYFLTYDFCIRLLSPSPHHRPDETPEHPDPDPPSKSWSAPLLAGAVAGVVGWAATFPMDVVRTRVMSADVEQVVRGEEVSRGGGVWRIARDSYRTEGWRVFFRGLGPTLVRAVPVNAVTFFVYEAVVSAFR